MLSGRFVMDRDAERSWRYLCGKYSGETVIEMAGKGEAMPDGTFPIAVAYDVELCIASMVYATKPIAVKRHICRRAGELGVETPLGFCGP
jgi:hypothetical protein